MSDKGTGTYSLKGILYTRCLCEWNNPANISELEKLEHHVSNSHKTGYKQGNNSYRCFITRFASLTRFVTIFHEGETKWPKLSYFVIFNQIS